jgi:hypothetical protein
MRNSFGSNEFDHVNGVIRHDDVRAVTEIDCGLTFGASFHALNQVLVEVHCRTIKLFHRDHAHSVPRLIFWPFK